MKTKSFVVAQTKFSYTRIPAIVAAIFVYCGTVTFACNVPVFRFALERWRPDPYRVVLVHRGPLSAADRALIAPLESQQEKAAANLVLRELDLSTAQPDSAQQVAIPQGDFSKPQIVVKYPEHLQIETPVWKGPVSETDLARLIDSPVRKELVKRLVDGQAAVWLFLECGDAEKDDAAAALVESELKKIEQELKLPELSDSPDDVLLTSTPLRLAFSMLRVPRGEPSEQATIQMLVHSESDLADRADPLVFPVFGRGRALFPLVGAGITKANILDAATFLVGPCSCQVKELNPGFDLLLAADWDSLLSLEGVELTAIAREDRGTPTGDAELVPIPSGAAPPPAAAPAAVVRAPSSSPRASAAPTTDRLNTTGKLFVSALAIAGVVMAALLARRR